MSWRRTERRPAIEAGEGAICCGTAPTRACTASHATGTRRCPVNLVFVQAASSAAAAGRELDPRS
jgi:hypothetical protein